LARRHEPRQARFSDDALECSRVKFGFYTSNSGSTGDPALVVELALRAEAAGWDGFFLWDHLNASRPPVSDPWVMLGAVAARTERIELGPLIVPLARRRPQKVALEAATLARLAPERVVLGVGLGAPDDFTRFGEDADWRVRSRKVEESLATIRESLPELAVWVSGEWPRKQPFHGVDLADGVFPIHRDGDTFRPLTPAEAATAVASLPERARQDFAMWSFNDDGSHELADYEDAGVTWWMVEGFLLEPDELRTIADAGPHRFIRTETL
jgi:alkanesulfonate monooxygenase SsuD/methylene tetrahydromethanopterin reductase-like flavin-dependent oxidoreductase (luciferase family)